MTKLDDIFSEINIILNSWDKTSDKTRYTAVLNVRNDIKALIEYRKQFEKDKPVYTKKSEPKSTKKVEWKDMSREDQRKWFIAKGIEIPKKYLDNNDEKKSYGFTPLTADELFNDDE